MSQERTLPGITYRRDIDGLRAIAVLAVVLFHAFPAWLPGGFVGVDVFFVISGFLISTIILEGLERGTFSFSAFYARRISRIFPALVLVLSATYAAGWVLLLPREFEQLGKHIAAGAGFVSNFLLWGEDGYFDASADSKPLLHLWSLAIEEQFYLLWPLSLWATAKLGRDTSRMTRVLAWCSFAYGLYRLQLSSNGVDAFYWPQCRFWQPLFGALLAHKVRASLPSDRTRFFSDDAKSAWGALLIAGSAALGAPDLSPTVWRTLATAGAVLMIGAGPRALVNRAVLSNPSLVWIGLVSYPLYLWHWPLLSFARIAVGQLPPLSYRVFAVLCAVVLAWLTTRWLEWPFRFGRPSWIKIPALVSMLCVLAAVGLHCEREAGFAARPVVLPKPGWDGDGGDLGFSLSECGVDAKKRELLGDCRMDSRPGVHLALLGDSKASALFPGLVRTSHENRRWLFIGGTDKGGTVPVLSDAELYKEHQAVVAESIAAIAANRAIDTVAIVTAIRQLFKLQNDHSIEDLPASNNGEVAFDGLRRAVGKIVASGKHVVIVVDNPTLRSADDCTPRKTAVPWLDALIANAPRPECSVSVARHRRLSAKYLELLHRVQAAHATHVTLFDTTRLLCDVEQGVCKHHKNGRPLYSYTDHISDHAAGLIGAELNNLVASALSLR